MNALFGIADQARRFLAAGVLNTLLTMVLYQALLFLMAPRPAYALTWLAGLAFVAAVYPARVFGVIAPTRATRLGMILVYAAGFLIGMALIRPATRVFGDQAGILPVLVATTLFNFAAMRIVVGLGERARGRDLL